MTGYATDGKFAQRLGAFCTRLTLEFWRYPSVPGSRGRCNPRFFWAVIGGITFVYAWRLQAPKFCYRCADDVPLQQPFNAMLAIALY
jgi:hypothetical protein